MNKVIILSGITGSGKSTLAHELDPIIIVNADFYFRDCQGNYRFDPAKLTEAHAKCFRRFINNLNRGDIQDVVVDNTNTTVEEIAPYYLGAQAFGYDVEILTVMCADLGEVGKAHARNKHGVSLLSAIAQHERLVRRVLPARWKNTNLPLQGI